MAAGSGAGGTADRLITDIRGWGAVMVAEPAAGAKGWAPPRLPERCGKGLPDRPETAWSPPRD
ncbi:hypothetical protein CEJ63_21355, partial [Acinetobacter baumannii]